MPLRLITKEGFVEGGPLLVDSFNLAYLDLDDALASDNLSFQLNLIHLLTERSSARNYARRIGTPGLGAGAEFNRAHQAGIDAEVAHLRAVIGDPSIRFIYEEVRPNGTLVFAYRSDEGYRVFHVFRGGAQAERGGVVFVQAADGTRMTIEQLRATRAAPPPAAPPPAASAVP
jgi:hypothetical protein